MALKRGSCLVFREGVKPSITGISRSVSTRASLLPDLYEGFNPICAYEDATEARGGDRQLDLRSAGLGV